MTALLAAGRRLPFPANLLQTIHPHYSLFLIFQTISYFLIGAGVSRLSLSLWSPESVYDSSIPFLPFMALPYMLYFPVMLTPAFLSLKKAEMRQLLICLVTASLATYSLAWTVSPLPSPRVSLEGQSGILITLVHALYKWDISPIYIPSLHSLHSLLIGLLLWRGGGFRRALLPCALLISLSTVFVKQHFLWDSLLSLLLAPLIIRWSGFLKV